MKMYLFLHTAVHRFDKKSRFLPPLLWHLYSILSIFKTAFCRFFTFFNQHIVLSCHSAVPFRFSVLHLIRQNQGLSALLFSLSKKQTSACPRTLFLPDPLRGHHNIRIMSKIRAFFPHSFTGAGNQRAVTKRRIPCFGTGCVSPFFFSFHSGSRGRNRTSVAGYLPADDRRKTPPRRSL